MRHGQTSSNLSGALDTAAPGAALTDLGARQAAAAAPLLVERGVSAAYSSHLLRAQQTAAAVADRLGVPAGTHEGLAEVSAGDLEMLTESEAVHEYAAGLVAWVHGDLSHRIRGGEDGHEFLARYDAAIADVCDEASAAGHEGIVVVTHGAALGTWVRSRATNLDDWQGLGRMRNTGIVVLQGDPGDFAIIESDSGPLAGPDYDEPDALS